MNVFFLAILTFRPGVGVPTPAPVPEPTLFVWQHYEGGLWMGVACDADETRPMEEDFWPMNNQLRIVPAEGWRLKRKIPVRVIYRRAWSRAQMPPDVPCCWPGEQVD